ncbi:cobalamin-binding protein [Candidatus Micrarchaeota archaeon]|nr:cobalamin-binding protein [Candidatus Micrarchaeota archaeon]
MKILSLAPSNTEILFALGAGDQIIGRTAYCDYPQEALQIPKIGDWTNPPISKIKELQPDLILTSTIVQEKLAQKLKKAKLPVAHIAPKNLVAVIGSIEKIGALVGKTEEAKKIAEHMLLRFAEIREKGETLKTHPKVYVEEWHKPPFVSGNWVPELAEIAGTEYYSGIAAGEYSKEVTLEQIKKFDPEIIIISICGLGAKTSKKLIEQRDGWNQLSAVKNDRIFVFDDSFLNRPGPRLVKGCSMIQELIEIILPCP